MSTDQITGVSEWILHAAKHFVAQEARIMTTEESLMEQLLQPMFKSFEEMSFL